MAGAVEAGRGVGGETVVGALVAAVVGRGAGVGEACTFGIGVALAICDRPTSVLDAVAAPNS